ncbi:MAG: DNA-binding protein WhiA [Actinomycetes bacterium]|jgi:DNA-binding protein WhiA|nr:DNA-binding protein WhiA [Actinomycetes bacterium]
MSFTGEVREELSRLEQKRDCCNRAELAALIRLQGTLTVLDRRCRVEISTESAQIARRVIKLIRKCFELKTELTVNRSLLHRTNSYLITLPAQPALMPALESLALDRTSWMEGGVGPDLVRRDCCAIAYLRGAFLGAGFIADPQGDFHFEIRSHSEPLASDISAMTARFGIESKVLERRNQWTVYLKGAEPIIDFLALVGAHKALLETENVRIMKSYRNDVNRRVNAEIANQEKAVKSALGQLDDIKFLESTVGLDSLPPALCSLARLRLKNPELSLKELGEAADPPLSKSAVNHRIRRIADTAARLRMDGA